MERITDSGDRLDGEMENGNQFSEWLGSRMDRSSGGSGPWVLWRWFIIVRMVRLGGMVRIMGWSGL